MYSDHALPSSLFELLSPWEVNFLATNYTTSFLQFIEVCCPNAADIHFRLMANDNNTTYGDHT